MNLRGTLRLPPGPLPERAARVRVEVRDVTEQDAPAPLPAWAELRDVPLVPGGWVPFRVADVPPLAGRRLAVQAHADLSGSGHVTPGDLLTTESVPVGDVAGEVEVPLSVI